tara:strand:+ start:106 stop:525 length:420 start_codon:yes stop_codon:yes gene_type:complete
MVETKEYKRQYYLKNKEHILKERAKYRESNKEKVNKANNVWYHKNHAKEIIKKWKKAGFKHTEYYFELLSIIYENATNCELCNVKFTGKGNTKKVCEHHHPSGCFRHICCHKCNMNKLKVDNQQTRVLLELHRIFARNN